LCGAEGTVGYSAIRAIRRNAFRGKAVAGRHAACARICAHYHVRMIPRPIDRSAPRRAVNLSLNSDMVAKARALGLNLSGIAEEAIAREVARATEEWFKAEIARGVAEHEEYLAKYGSLADAVRATLEAEDGDA
jgi:antitoxin CcdA